MAKKYRKQWAFVVWLLVILCLVAALFFIYKLIKTQQALAKAQATYYATFGINIPLGFTIHGIDISSHQNIIYWPAVKAMKVSDIAINFSFIKATEGINNVDKHFKINWQITRRLGITHGAYHFFIATKNGVTQANNFINEVKLQNGDLPPVVDIEELYGVSPIVMQQRLKACLDKLEKQYQVIPIIYTNVNFYDNYLGKSFDKYPLWIAHYLKPNKPRIKRDWLFWQHSDKAHISGITTFADFNIFNGDTAAFKKILIK